MDHDGTTVNKLVATTRIIIEAREIKSFVHTYTEEVWGHCTLTNEINAGGYLYMSWYSKWNLGSVCLTVDQNAKRTEKREALSARLVQGVIDWLISAVSEMRCDCCCETSLGLLW